MKGTEGVCTITTPFQTGSVLSNHPQGQLHNLISNSKHTAHTQS